MTLLSLRVPACRPWPASLIGNTDFFKPMIVHMLRLSLWLPLKQSLKFRTIKDIPASICALNSSSAFPVTPPCPSSHDRGHTRVVFCAFVCKPNHPQGPGKLSHSFPSASNVTGTFCAKTGPGSVLSRCQHCTNPSGAADCNPLECTSAPVAT